MIPNTSLLIPEGECIVCSEEMSEERGDEKEKRAFPCGGHFGCRTCIQKIITNAIKKATDWDINNLTDVENTAIKNRVTSIIKDTPDQLPQCPYPQCGAKFDNEEDITRELLDVKSAQLAQKLTNSEHEVRTPHNQAAANYTPETQGRPLRGNF